MTPWLGILASTLAAVIVVAGLLGAQAAFRTNRRTADIANYETSIKGWKERVELQDRQIADRDALIEQRDEQFEQLKRESDVRDRHCQLQLQDLQSKYDTVLQILQGAPQLEMLSKIVHDYEGAAFRLEEVLGRFEIIDRMTGVADQLKTERGDSSAS